ncbi:MAG: hypothetical protein IAF94_08520 [Pirellulaceae bacterium]|nr:hypothetical protein [Pirellulaceae bacterium]
MSRYLSLVLVAFASLASNAEAFEFSNLKRNESKAGTVRFARPTGQYSLLPGETLKSVRLIYTISSSTVPATSAGQFTTNPNTWNTGVGDVALRTYKVEFVVRRNGQDTKITTQTFTYGQ